jgi:site-specific DNA recombinase
MGTTKVIRCATYCRISSDRWGTEAGVDRQRVDTERIAESLGYEITHRIVDNDRSASRYARREREGWVDLMELVESGTVDAVIAYDLDRLTRQNKELERLIDAAEKGTIVRTASGLVDLSTQGGILVARMLCDMAAHEAGRASERQRAKLRHDAANGVPHWPCRPFGLTMQGELVPAEAEAVQRWADWLVEEGVSTVQIAVRMNDTDLPPTRGGKWQSSGVAQILANPRTAGLRAYKGEIVGPGTWAAILSQERWHEVCTALNLRAQPKRGGKRSLLTGLVRCGVCGGPMSRTNASDRAELRCVKRPELVTGCGQSINAAAVEKHITAAVLEVLGDVRPTPTRKAAPGWADNVAKLRADLAELAEMMGAGRMTMAEWKAARGPLEERLKAAEAASGRDDVQAALVRLAGTDGTLTERWDTIDLAAKRRLIGLVVERIIIGPNVRRGPTDLRRVSVVGVEK